VDDEMQSLEHSVEAKLPFLQHARRDLRHVSILVPAMPQERMREIAPLLARAIAAATRGLRWGPDFAIVISTDAVHYGDEDWGGRDFARYGADDAGYRQAVAHDRAIMDECFAGELVPDKARLFSSHTVREDDWREYKWTWCGRYSVPFGMLVAHALQRELRDPPLVGKVLGYATSIDTPRLRVDDLGGMGVTAPANLRHWVGYASVGYL
jgi:AmmeMemoRadiSam system protein B